MLKRLGDREDAIWIFRVLNQLNQLTQGAALFGSERAEFEAAHMRLFEFMRQCNDARRELIRLVQKHIQDVGEGKSVTVGGNGHIIVDEDIEPALNRALNSFFVASRTVLYHLFGQKDDPSKGPHVKTVTEILTGYNLSFAQVHKDTQFDKFAKEYLNAKSNGAKETHLIDVIRSDRATWTLGLQDIRDKIIHDTSYQGLKMIYKANRNKVAIGFPRLNGVDLIPFMEMFWNNLVDAVEEIVVACIDTRMSAFITFVRIPEEKWDPNLPNRWTGVMLEGPTSTAAT